MRTTLTLDDELARLLKEKAHRSRRSFKQTVNETLRAGLAAAEAPVAEPYRLEPASLGAPRAGVDIDRALALAAELENEELARKLELRK